LTLIGIPALLFISVDVIRLASPKVNIFIFQNLLAFFREKEKHTFSSATLFLISCFLTILLFAKSIATMAIIFLIFGDIFAKFTGLEHGKIKIFTKTLRGSLAYFATCLIAGYIWSHFAPLTAMLIMLGSLAAALTELLPIGVSDNLMVPLVSASVITIAKMF
jgi:dolichol kinase